MNARLFVAPIAGVIVFVAVAVGGGVCVGPSVSPVGRSFAACPQTPATLNVIATGTGPLSYQWRRYPRVGPQVAQTIPNSNNPTLTIPLALLSDAGKYDCVITNACGSVTTPIYRLAILAADRGGAGGIQGSDGAVSNDDFIVFINQFFASDVRADIGSAGGVSLPDGDFDNNDFISFINLFFSYPGCP
jgi:hypothetical protein